MAVTAAPLTPERTRKLREAALAALREVLYQPELSEDLLRGILAFLAVDPLAPTDTPEGLAEWAVFTGAFAELGEVAWAAAAEHEGKRR